MKSFLQKLFLLLVLFLGGCQLDAPYPEINLQHMIGGMTGVKAYELIDNPTMYFVVNSDATSVTLYTYTSTNTLAYTSGSYDWGAYEGAGYKLELFDIHSKGGSFKLNGTLTDEDYFTWRWSGGDVDLTPKPELESGPDSGSMYALADAFINTLTNTSFTSANSQYGGVANVYNIKYYVENDKLYYSYSYNGNSRTEYITRDDIINKIANTDNRTLFYSGMSSVYVNNVIKVTYSDSSYTSQVSITHTDMFQNLGTQNDTLTWTK